MNNRIDFQVIYVCVYTYTVILDKKVCIFFSLCSTSYLTLIVLLESVLSIFFSISFLILKTIDVNLFSSLCNISSQRKNHHSVKSYKRKGDLFIFTIRNNSSLYLDKHHIVFDSFLLRGFFQCSDTLLIFLFFFWLFFMIDPSPFSLSPS
jgi:hypothetical protein